MSGNGKTTVTLIAMDLQAINDRLSRVLTKVLKLCDKEAREDVSDDPFLKEIYDLADIGLTVGQATDKDAHLVRIKRAAASVMELDFAQVEGAAIRALVKPILDAVEANRAQIHQLLERLK